MGRAAYIRKRLLLMIFVLFGVTLIIFGMIHLVPGDPAFLILGDRATEEKAAELRHQLGLDQSLPQQYWLFISGVFHGNFGMSLLYRQPVNSLVFRRIPVTFFLTGYAMALTAIITLPISLWAATHKNKLSDHLIRAGFLFALTTPSFWLGILLILLFSLRLRLFPVAGYGENFTQHLRYLFLPSLTLALQLSAVLIRNLRNGIINTLDSDFVRTAWAKGLG
ncbi:MAG: ABC transporter permease, partial [Chloroflexota bacterium]|nr:ABC transporter permease [Chloroflexota bacterium]